MNKWCKISNYKKIELEQHTITLTKWHDLKDDSKAQGKNVVKKGTFCLETSIAFWLKKSNSLCHYFKVCTYITYFYKCYGHVLTVVNYINILYHNHIYITQTLNLLGYLHNRYRALIRLVKNLFSRNIGSSASPVHDSWTDTAFLDLLKLL